MARDRAAVTSYTSLLESAVLKGQQDTVALLLRQGVDVNIHFPSGSTPLHDAALKGYDAIVNLLVAKGADVNARDAAEQRPCMAERSAETSSSSPFS
jgi:ankyrin repeat protein